MEAAEATVEIDPLAAVMDLGPRASVRGVSEDDAAVAGELEPAVEALWLGRKDVLAAEQIPELGFATVEQELVGARVDGGDWIGGVFIQEDCVGIGAAVLHEGAVAQSDQGGALAHPLLEYDILGQLTEVVLLATDSNPETDTGRIAQRPEHRDLVVAQKHHRVGSVAGVAQGAAAEGTVVDQGAEEDRAPLGCGIRFERLEETLEIAVHVPDDEDRQVALTRCGHRTMLIGPGKAPSGVG